MAENSTKEVLKAILAVTGKVNAIDKEKYINYDTVLDLLRQPVIDAGLVIIPSDYEVLATELREETYFDKYAKKDKKRIVRWAQVKGYWRICHESSSETMLACGIGEAQDYGSSATEQANTSAYKKMLMQTFLIYGTEAKHSNSQQQQTTQKALVQSNTDGLLMNMRNTVAEYLDPKIEDWDDDKHKNTVMTFIIHNIGGDPEKVKAFLKNLQDGNENSAQFFCAVQDVLLDDKMKAMFIKKIQEYLK